MGRIGAVEMAADVSSGFISLSLSLAQLFYRAENGYHLEGSKKEAAHKTADEPPRIGIFCVTVPAALVSVRGGSEFVGMDPLRISDET